MQSRIQNLNAVPEQLRVPKAENDLFQRCISNPLLIFFSRVRLLSCIIPYTLWLATLVAFQSCFLSDNLKTWLQISSNCYKRKSFPWRIDFFLSFDNFFCNMLTFICTDWKQFFFHKFIEMTISIKGLKSKLKIDVLLKVRQHHK